MAPIPVTALLAAVEHERPFGNIARNRRAGGVEQAAEVDHARRVGGAINVAKRNLGILRLCHVCYMTFRREQSSSTGFPARDVTHVMGGS